MDSLWLWIVIGSSATGIVASLAFRSSVRTALLIAFVAGLGGIAALVLSSLLPGGLSLSWPKVAGVGAICSVVSSIFTKFVFSKKNDNQHPLSINEGTGLMLAISSVFFLTVIAITGPGVLSILSWCALSLVLVAIGVYIWASRRKEERSDGTIHDMDGAHRDPSNVTGVVSEKLPGEPE